MAKTARSNESIPFGPQIRNNALQAESNRFYVVTVPLPYKARQRQGISIAEATWVPQSLNTQSNHTEDISAATEGYILRDEERIAQFLCIHRDLIPLLSEARERIGTYFPGSPLALEVTIDPEATEASQLVAIIIESSSPDEAFDRLERLDREWWLGAVGRAHGKLCINVEFT